MNLRCLAIVLGGWLAAAPEMVQADIFTLEQGGRVVGALVNEKETPRQTYQIRTASGITVTLPKAAVKEHARQRPALEEYTEIKPTFPDTADGQWELAEWCQEKGLYTQRKTHLARVVALEPDHVLAHRALGHIKADGRWATPKEVMEARGYVEFEGRWKLPQEVALIKARKADEAAEREWFRKIAMWRDWIVTGDRRADEGKEKIRTIYDPIAMRALKRNLTTEPLFQIRLLYIEAVANMDSLGATELLVQRSLADEHREVRLTALEYLAKAKRPEAIVSFIRNLRHADNNFVNRSALGLTMLGSPTAVGPLIDSLYTPHKYQVIYGNPGGGMSSTFNKSPGPRNAQGFATTPGGGMGGLSMGGGTKIVTAHVANPQVLEALVELTGQNFSYDVAAWKQWFAAQRKPDSLDARRD